MENQITFQLFVVLKKTFNFTMKFDTKTMFPFINQADDTIIMFISAIPEPPKCINYKPSWNDYHIYIHQNCLFSILIEFN